MFAFDRRQIVDSTFRLARKSQTRKSCAHEKHRGLHVADTLKIPARWNLFEMADIIADVYGMERCVVLDLTSRTFLENSSIQPNRIHG